VPSALIQSLNPLIGDFINTIDPQETLAESKSRNAAVSRDAEVWYVFGWKRGRHWQ
jgi:hypothetical protein